MDELIKNRIYETVCEGYTNEGLGVCRIQGRAVFVPGALNGERISVKITKISTSVAYGKIESILSPSEFRIEPKCQYYKVCGGCSTLHMAYEEELRFKLAKVNDALSRIGRQEVSADEIIPADTRLNYRNKVTFQVAEKNGHAYFGYYSPRSHNIVPVSKCMISDSRSLLLAQSVVDFMESHNIMAYDETSGKGAVRHIFIRNALRTDDICLCVSSAEGFGKNTSLFVNFIRTVCPFISGIVLNINKMPGNELLAGEFYTLFGVPDVSDILSDFSFSISPRSFYQVNPAQAEKLYSEAVKYISDENCDTCLDLYCGIGTISLCLSRIFSRVIGVEVVPEAIENAVHNAEANNVSNVDFVCADAGGALKLFKSENIKIDAALVDPPRKGMDAEAVKTVCEMNPERIVYVSCNPSTLARDLIIFNEYGYHMTRAKAVDMFPGTFHVECVVLLTKVHN